MKTLTQQDYETAAKFLNCDVAAVKAVKEVESSGSGFQADGKPKILFEGHWFWKYTGGKFGVSNVSYPKWVRNYYNENQHNRLEKAAKLDREAALKSASWGMFQIMGGNHKKAGFSTLQSFINAMYKDEASQLLAFCNFVKNSGLQDELQRKDWVGFAYGYNGAGYKVNNYHTKLANAYKKYSKKQ